MLQSTTTGLGEKGVGAASTAWAVGTRWQAPKQQLGAVSEQLSTAAAVCGPKDTQGTRAGPLGSLACERWLAQHRADRAMGPPAGQGH